MRSLVQDYLSFDQGSVLVEISERWAPDFDGSDEDMRDEVGDLTKVGLWYVSGKARFGPKQPDEEEGN